MIHFIRGKISEKRENFTVIDVSGVGFKIFVSSLSLSQLPPIGSDISLYSHLHYREPSFDLYGFLTEEELSLFELLVAISGIGPKSAMGILGLAEVGQIAVAINSGESELLTKVAGVGKKTAERVVLELKGKLDKFVSGKEAVATIKSDIEIEEALSGLGFSRSQIKEALKKVDPNLKSVEERLRSALKFLKH